MNDNSNNYNLLYSPFIFLIDNYNFMDE